MSSIKRFLPVILLLVLSLYVFSSYDSLPSVVVQALIFLPPLLSLAVAVLSVHFNRSSVFFYLLLIITANVSLGMGWLSSPLSYALAAILIPVGLLIYSVLPERGVFNRRAIPAYTVLLIGVVLVPVTALLFSGLAESLIMKDWLPARYFDWTRIPQAVLGVWLFVGLYLLVLSFLRPATHRVAVLGIYLLQVLQFHFGDTSRSLTVLSSGALMFCLYAVLQESWRMAYLDELTELPGRRALREKFHKLAGLYSVAMLDVDHFKKFNDNYGHDAGDAVLRMIAARINRVPGGGLAYRYGGEEFTVVFAGKNKQEAMACLETVRETIARSPFVVNREGRRKTDGSAAGHKPRSVQVTVSIGVAESGNGSASPWDILKTADKALYRAKKQGRNRVCG